ncbi:MAG: Transmembrane s isoform 1 [Trebouxia sp. A1-2]|nr:MAG: Transmembrane s isoform 1 [Trebouxia sp. A1-2]
MLTKHPIAALRYRRVRSTLAHLCCSLKMRPLKLIAAVQIPANQQGYRHAILHDFCMGIPYGSIVLAAGLVSLLFGSGQRGIAFAAGGAGILASAFFSLVQWRAQRPSTMFTLGSAGRLFAGITAGLAWGFWGLVEAGIAAVPNTVMFALSLAMLTFLIYNVFAGGNPPKKTTAEDDEQLAAAAAAS